jgi:hypothetical protein
MKEKLFYFCLLTNQHTNPAGVYPCTMRDMRADFGVSREEIEETLKKFEDEGKAFFYNGYIIIPKWMKHQKLEGRGNLLLGAIQVLKSLPDEIKVFISDRAHYDFDVRKYIEIPGEECPAPEDGGEAGEECPEPGETAPVSEDGVQWAENSENEAAERRKNGVQWDENRTKSDHDLDSDSDLDSEFDSEKKEKESFSLPENKPVKNKEDAIKIWNKARGFWNELDLKPECRDLMMRGTDRDEILRTFQHYSWAEIKNAIDNYSWHKFKAGSEYRPPPPYLSLAGFLKTGVEKYFDDDAVDQQFKEVKK